MFKNCSSRPTELYVNSDNLDDECYNDEWADCMGFDLHRLGELEVEFLNALDWKCHVSVDQFSTVLKQLEVELALNQQSKSGLFTYNTARNLDIMGKYFEKFLTQKKY